MTKKIKLAPGMAVKTNETWKRKIGMTPRTGVVDRPDPTIRGAWYVRMDGMPPGMRPWPVHECWLEVA